MAARNRELDFSAFARDRDGVHDAGLPCHHLRHLHEAVWNGSAIGLFGDQTLRTDDRRTNFAQGRQTVFRQRRKSPRYPYCNAAKRWHARLDTYSIEAAS